MIEPSASAIPWMFATGNHEPELFSAQVAADNATVASYEPLGYGGLVKRLDLPSTGPSSCPSVYSFAYGNVGIISLDANELSWEIQGLPGYSRGAQASWLEDQLAAWRCRATTTCTSAPTRSCTTRRPTAPSRASRRSRCPRPSPAPPGQRTTMVLRFINEQGRELDRVVFSRTAGQGPGALA